MNSLIVMYSEEKALFFGEMVANFVRKEVFQKIGNQLETYLSISECEDFSKEAYIINAKADATFKYSNELKKEKGKIMNTFITSR